MRQNDDDDENQFPRYTQYTVYSWNHKRLLPAIVSVLFCIVAPSGPVILIKGNIVLLRKNETVTFPATKFS